MHVSKRNIDAVIFDHGMHKNEAIIVKINDTLA